MFLSGKMHAVVGMWRHVYLNSYHVFPTISSQYSAGKFLVPKAGVVVAEPCAVSHDFAFGNSDAEWGI